MEAVSGYPFGLGAALFTTIVIILALWSAVWKAIALWMSARRKQTAWYVVMIIINTLGILEIIYIFAVAKNRELKL